MLYTLSQAREALKRYVDQGSCNNTIIDARINEALERLTDNADFECMKATMRIATCNKSFTLPFNVEKLMYVDVNGTPSKIFGLPYQFLSSGPGDLDYRNASSGFRDVMDQGESPVQFDIPYSYVDGSGVTVDTSTTGMRILAFSTAAEDTGKTVKIRGFAGSGNGDEVNAGRDSGEDVVINRWEYGVEGHISGFWNSGFAPSTAYFREITEIIKPETKGYVSLFAVDGSNSVPLSTYFSYLAKLHPLQTIPQFRRYAVTNTGNGTVPSSLLALVRLRHVPLVDASDILPIDSMQALKLMVMALREENAGNLQGAVNLEERAVKVMQNREKARTVSDGTPVIINSEYRTSVGRHLNRGGLIL